MEDSIIGSVFKFCIIQGALGELTFESEAAERLRVELRTERAAARELKDRLAQAQVNLRMCITKHTWYQLACFFVR